MNVECFLFSVSSCILGDYIKTNKILTLHVLLGEVRLYSKGIREYIAYVR